MELKYILHNCHFEREKKNFNFIVKKKTFLALEVKLKTWYIYQYWNVKILWNKKQKIYIFYRFTSSQIAYTYFTIYTKNICHWTKISLESSIRLKGELCAQTDEFNLFWLVKQIITIYIYIYSLWDIHYMNPYNGPIQKCNSSMGRLLRMLQCLWLVNSNLIRCYVCYSVYDWSIQIWWGVTYVTVFMIGQFKYYEDAAHSQCNFTRIEVWISELVHCVVVFCLSRDVHFINIKCEFRKKDISILSFNWF